MLSDTRLLNKLVATKPDLKKVVTAFHELTEPEKQNIFISGPLGLAALEYYTICSVSESTDLKSMLQLPFDAILAAVADPKLNAFLKRSIELDCRGKVTLDGTHLSIETCEIKSSLKKGDSKLEFNLNDQAILSSGVKKSLNLEIVGETVKIIV